MSLIRVMGILLWKKLKILYLKNKNQLTNDNKKNKIILLFNGTNLNSMGVSSQ